MSRLMSLGRLLRRAVVAFTLAALCSFVSSGPAAAHSAGRNASASNYVSRVLAVTPKATTFRARVIEAGNRLEVRWLSGNELQIFDYDGFPYLRLGPLGSFQNMQSAATYINADRQGTTAIPDITPSGPPEWRKTSGASVARFHYHPIHYMGSVPPPQVERARDRTHLIQTWKLDVRQGSRAYVARGDLRWVPGPSPAFALIAAAFTGLTVGAAAIGLARRRGVIHAVPVFVAAIIVLVIVDAVHLFGISFGVIGGSPWGRAFTIGWISMGAWIIAAGSSIALVKRRFDALYPLVFAAGIITVVGGLSDIGILSASSVPFAGSVAIARITIALTLGLGVGVVVAGVVVTGVTRPRLPADDPADNGPEAPASTL